MTNKELLEDLLIEFDELGMEPTTIVPNPSERAIRWKRELMSAIEYGRAEVAREIFEEIRDLIRFTMEPNRTTLYAKIEFEKLEAIKKKYTQPEPPEGD